MDTKDFIKYTHGNTIDDMVTILEESFDSLITFSDYFFPHHKQDEEGNVIPPATIHYEFEKLLRGAVGNGVGDGYYNLLSILPRGSAKSTMANVFFILWCAIFTNKQYMILAGASGKSISDHFETIKEEIRTNRMLHLAGVKPLEGGLDNKESFEFVGPRIDGYNYPTANGKVITLSVYSASSFPRGKKKGAKRPDLIVIDDLERKGSGTQPGIESQTYNDKIKDLIHATILPSGFNAKSLQIIILGTIMSEKQQLWQLYQQAQSGTLYPEFKYIKYSMVENYGSKDAYSIWPEKISLEDFDKMVESARENGTLDIIYNEYLSIPMSPDDIIFDRKMFQYYILRGGLIYRCDRDGKIEENSPVVNLRDTTVVISVDLAFTVTNRSDFTSFAICAVDRDENCYILDIVYGRWSTYEIMSQAGELISTYKPHMFGVEGTSGGKAIIEMLERELQSNKNFNGVIELSPGGLKKADRIINYLQPPYRQGRMFHKYEASYLDDYEEQVLGVNRSGISTKYDDMVDSVSYTYQLTDVTAIYNRYGEDNGDDYDDIYEGSSYI